MASYIGAQFGSVTDIKKKILTLDKKKKKKNINRYRKSKNFTK